MAKNNLMMTIGILVQTFIILTGASQAVTITVPDDYPKIQSAIDNASNGDTIEVHSGTYFELVDVYKPLALKGVNTGGGIPVVDANMLGSPITLSYGESTIEGFKVINSGIGYSDAGIRAFSNNNIIRNNEVLGYGGLGGGFGIYLYQSSNNTINENSVNSSVIGIYLLGPSDNNTLNSNIAARNNFGITAYLSNNNTIHDNSISSNNGNGISLEGSSNNSLIGNIIDSNGADGLAIHDSDRNIVIDNTVSLNLWGITLIESNLLDNNIIYHNNIINNTIQAYDNDPASNNWYNITSLEGNYWSDYTGVDDGSGTGKHDFSGDHIGDTLIPHPSTGYDYYPYMYASGWMRPTIVVYTDKKGYSAGNKMYIGLNITNPGSVRNASVYIWIDLPGGGKSWVAKLSSVTLAAGLDYNKMPWKVITLPNIPPGNYSWHAVLLDPVVKETISESISPWTFSNTSAAEAGNIKELEKALQGVSGEADLVK